MNNERPTFGASPAQIAAEEKRQELGALWKRTTRNNEEFLSIKLNLTKDLLKQLSETTEEIISVNLVAFSNKHKEKSDNRPDFRIYEERKRV